MFLKEKQQTKNTLMIFHTKKAFIRSSVINWHFMTFSLYTIISKLAQMSNLILEIFYWKKLALMSVHINNDYFRDNYKSIVLKKTLQLEWVHITNTERLYERERNTNSQSKSITIKGVLFKRKDNIAERLVIEIINTPLIWQTVFIIIIIIISNYLFFRKNKPAFTGLNDYRPDFLIMVMTSFERLVQAYLKYITGPLMDTLQFAYWANRSVDDAVNMGLHYIPFVDFSCAFDTIIPEILHSN